MVLSDLKCSGPHYIKFGFLCLGFSAIKAPRRLSRRTKGIITLTVTGNLKHNGKPLKFEGSGIVKVIRKQGKFTDEFENWNQARDVDLFAKNFNGE
jgi:hypothetical protein